MAVGFDEFRLHIHINTSLTRVLVRGTGVSPNLPC